MPPSHIRALGLLALLGPACGDSSPFWIPPPDVPGRQTLLVALESGGQVRVEASRVETPGALVQTGPGKMGEFAITFVYFAQTLEELGLAAGSVPAQDPLDPLPRFAEAHRLILVEDRVAEWERHDQLTSLLDEFLYPRPAGCREVTRGDRMLCVPNGCPGECERDFHFDPPEPIAALDSAFADDGVSVVREGAEYWLYFVTKRWTATSTSNPGRGEHAKVRLQDPVTPDLDSLTQLSHLPSSLRAVRRPSVTRDGLELAFSAWPEGRNAYHVYIAHRRSVDDPFGPARFAIAGLGSQDMMDPLILLDPSIVLLWSGVPDKLTLFRRESAEEGSVEFSPDISTTQSLSPDPLRRLGNVAGVARPNLSCDGWHLLLMRKLGDQIVPTAALIARHQPLELGPFIDVNDLLPPTGRSYNTWAEHPDCSVAYLSDGERIYVARRRRS